MLCTCRDCPDFPGKIGICRRRGKVVTPFSPSCKKIKEEEVAWDAGLSWAELAQLIGWTGAARRIVAHLQRRARTGRQRWELKQKFGGGK